MQLGIHVVQPPSTRAPAVLRATAHAAEALGYRSLWVGDRLVPGQRGASGSSRPLDAVATLAYLAARTERVGLGTSVLAGAWYPPALLARSLATVDQLSQGRLLIGLGSSPSPREAAAAGVGDADPDARVDELLTVLSAAWGPEPARHSSARTTFEGWAPGPLPVQLPRPPILLTGRTEAELERVGRSADGWLAGPAAVEELAVGWRLVQRSAVAAGRDPSSLRLVVRVGLVDAAPATEVARQVAELAALGVAEVILEVDAVAGLDASLARYAEVAEAVELQALA